MTYPGGPPEWPSPTLLINRKTLRKRVEKIEAGAYFIRAYSHGRGYGSAAFNPTPASLTDASSGGRFDGTPDDPYSFLYVATPYGSPHVAFWETFQNDFSFNDPVSGGRLGLVLKTDLESRSFAYLRVLQPLRLLRLHDHEDVSQVHTLVKVLRGDDRLKTRAWAQFIRLHIGKKIHGFIYTSAVLGSRANGDAVVLFGDKCAPGLFLQTDPPEIPMASAAGALLVDQALSGTPFRRAL